ncbi:MAG: N-acetylmuramoyl-L-alanine amidase CwlD [Clostridia bacterium]|nr:N-acetylmuramoyl-L-alanine amidase CwlD [Clostridia bacterium]
MVLKLRKMQTVLWALGFLLLCLMLYSKFTSEAASVALPVADRIIVIDAGHGGLDGGAVSESGIVEKDINLKIANYLKNYLEQGGAKIVMTRDDDSSLHSDENATVKNKKRQDLLKRREIANKSGADMMISLHLNKFEIEKYKGAQAFYETNFAESKKLATSIQKSLKDNLDKSNTRMEMKIDSSKLQFKELSVPSVLIECGFLSNPDEALLLSTEEYQKKVAFAVYMGILSFYNC